MAPRSRGWRHFEKVTVTMKTKVVYAPQADEPQESSAAHEYAQRISSLVEDSADSSNASDDVSSNANAIVVERLTLESLDFLMKGDGGEDEETIAQHIFIISCAADGSVDRIVRKLIRSLKNSTSGGISTQRPKVAIALLGHARCENSANQMKDTIFGSGRKFCRAVKSLLEVDGDKNANDSFSTLEVQVELEGPDAAGGFDDWVRKLHVPCSKASS